MVSKTRDVSGLPVYSISTTWTQDPVFFTNDGKVWLICNLHWSSSPFCVRFPLCAEQSPPCPGGTRKCCRTGMAHHAYRRTGWVLVRDCLCSRFVQCLILACSIWQYDRAQSSKAYLSAPNGLFSSVRTLFNVLIHVLIIVFASWVKVIFTTKPLTKFRIVVQSNDEN